MTNLGTSKIEAEVNWFLVPELGRQADREGMGDKNPNLKQRNKKTTSGT